MLIPPKAADSPVNSTRGPYSVLYSPMSPILPVLTSASLIGPQSTLPIPRPAAKTANIMVVSDLPFCFSTDIMIPGYVLVNDPAKKPYKMQKMNNGARVLENPHIKNTDIVEPIVEINMQVVTCHRSIIPPIPMHPNTEATLNSMRVSADRLLLAPIALAYVGK